VKPPSIFPLGESNTAYLSVLDRNRKPLGYVDVARLKESRADPVRYLVRSFLRISFDVDDAQGDPVRRHMTKFKRTSSHPYSLITVSTPLAELEEFLKTNIFALGVLHDDHSIKSVIPDPIIVTDSERKFVLAVATSQDLENFVSRWGS
jgi:hypothetical protein